MKFYFLLYSLTAFSLSFTSDLNDLIIEITSGRNTLSNDEINEYVLKNSLEQDENILILIEHFLSLSNGPSLFHFLYICIDK